MGGKIRIQWRCTCGEICWVDASKDLAQRCKKLVEEAAKVVSVKQHQQPISAEAGESQNQQPILGSFPLSESKTPRHVPAMRTAIRPGTASTQSASSIKVAKILNEYELEARTISKWSIEQSSIIVRCGTYVALILGITALIVFGGLAVAFTGGDRIWGVHPSQIALFAWLVGGFFLAVAKSRYVDAWPWHDFLRGYVVCRSLSDLSDVSGVKAQIVLLYLLRNEWKSPLITQSSYNGIFCRKSLRDGFSIDVPVEISTMLASGFVILKKLNTLGEHLICIDGRKGGWDAAEQGRGGNWMTCPISLQSFSTLPLNEGQMNLSDAKDSHPVEALKALVPNATATAEVEVGDAIEKFANFEEIGITKDLFLTSGGKVLTDTDYRMTKDSWTTQSHQQRQPWAQANDDILPKSPSPSDHRTQATPQAVNKPSAQEQQRSRGLFATSQLGPNATLTPAESRLSTSTTLEGQRAEANSPFSPDDSSNIISDNGRQQSQFVLFCIYQRSQIQHAQIEAPECRNDEDFFANLRHEYRHLRGFWRFWFSPLQFDHCEFVKFTRFHVNELTRVGRDLPLDTVYRYSPRPPGPHEDPPITPHEFRRRFYTDLPSPCGCHEALERIPKRQKRFQVNLHVNGREDMWGLHVELRPSYSIILLWHVFILCEGLGFMLWWVSRHNGDLQTAAVPATLALTALMALWLPISRMMKVT